MNNLPYDTLQFFWFPLSIICGKIGLILHGLFSTKKRFLCSELIAKGFYKESDYLFNKPQENVLPVDFDNPALFEEVKDIWLSTSLTFLIFVLSFEAKFWVGAKFCPLALKRCA
jgi:hypothetical protein